MLPPFFYKVRRPGANRLFQFLSLFKLAENIFLQQGCKLNAAHQAGPVPVFYFQLAPDRELLNSSGYHKIQKNRDLCLKKLIYRKQHCCSVAAEINNRTILVFRALVLYKILRGYLYCLPGPFTPIAFKFLYHFRSLCNKKTAFVTIHAHRAGLLRNHIIIPPSPGNLQAEFPGKN